MHQHGIGTTDTRRESGQRGAQHVHPRVALAIIGNDVTACTVAAPASGLAHHLGNPRPQLARRAQLRDRHELVVIRGVSETDLPQRIPNGKAAFSEQPQVCDPGRDAAGQFPRRARTLLWNAGPSTVIARTPPRIR